MKRGTLLLVALSVVAFLAALYCLAGYAMNASFSSAAGTTEGYAGAAIMWTAGMAVSLVGCVALAFAAWCRSRKPAR
jgi:hypothetical protein